MDLGLFQHIDSNRRKSVLLIAFAVVFALSVGGVLGAASWGSPWAGLALGGGIATVMGIVSWLQGSRIVLFTANAEEIGKEDDPELVNVVEEMAIASGLPRPDLRHGRSRDERLRHRYLAGQGRRRGHAGNA